jgi:hypothetical protein
MRLLILLCILPVITWGQTSLQNQVQIAIDVESAEAICRLLDQEKADTVQIGQVAALYGNQLLIQKVKGYSGSGEDVFRNTLKEIIETGTVKGRDDYNWKLVKSKLPEIKQLLAYISSDKDKFLQEVTALIQPYTPPGLQAEAKACFLAGGGSLGFTIGDDPTFNVALQKIGNDLEGLKYLVAHELYHTLQDVGQRSRRYQSREKEFSYQQKAAYYICYNLWAEGIATLVGDMSVLRNPKGFSKEQADQFRKNRERRYQNFQLLEALLYRQYNDSTMDFSETYNIAFTTAFDETSYFAGYEMAKKIAAHRGDQAIAAILLKDPIRFISDYIDLYKSRPDDKTFIRFSPSIESIVDKLLLLENKL